MRIRSIVLRDFLISNITFIILLIIPFFFVGVIRDFFKPFYYASTVGNLDSNFFLSYSVSTKRALLPFEVIDIQIKITIPEKLYYIKAGSDTSGKKKVDSLFIMFSHANPVEPKHNGANDKFWRTISFEGESEMIYLNNDTLITNGDNKYYLFRCNAAVKYSNVGSHSMIIHAPGAPSEPIKFIDIAGSEALMNKRRNDLLAIFTLVGYLNLLIISFKMPAKVKRYLLQSLNHRRK